MDKKLRSIVDYEAVDAKVKSYDKSSFIKWRNEQKKSGSYEENMALIHSGWDDLIEEDIDPWTKKDEEKIIEWLSQ